MQVYTTEQKTATLNMIHQAINEMEKDGFAVCTLLFTKIGEPGTHAMTAIPRQKGIEGAEIARDYSRRVVMQLAFEFVVGTTEQGKIMTVKNGKDSLNQN